MATFEVPDIILTGLNASLIPDIKSAVRSIIKSACAPLSQVEIQCNKVNPNLYNTIDAPDHYRVQHMVYTISNDMQWSSFGDKTIS